LFSFDYSNFRVPSKAKEAIQDKDYESILHHQLKQGLVKSSVGADSDSGSDSESDDGASRQQAKEAKAKARREKTAHVPSAMDSKTEEELLAVLEEYEDKILVSLGRDLEREDQARSRLTSAAGSRGGDRTGPLDVSMAVDGEMTGDVDGQDDHDEEDDEDVLNSLEIDAIVSYKEDEDDDDEEEEDDEE
jgi:hypothetical protein